MFKTISTSGLAILGALTASLVLPMAATAAPFTLDNIEPKGFDCASAAPPAGPGGLSCVSTLAEPTPNHIEWVEGSLPVSSLDLLSLTTINNVNAGDAPVRFNKLTHNNIVISSAFSYAIDIVNTLQVTDQNGLAIVLTDSNAINIKFTETPNVEPCIGPPGPTPCNDFFDFNAAGLAPVLFSSGGIDYQMIFGLEAGNGTIVDGNRVYTAENGISELFVTARIVAVNVPEPMTLALLGLGLLGIGFTTRQRKM